MLRRQCLKGFAPMTLVLRLWSSYRRKSSLGFGSMHISDPCICSHFRLVVGSHGPKSDDSYEDGEPDPVTVDTVGTRLRCEGPSMKANTRMAHERLGHVNEEASTVTMLVPLLMRSLQVSRSEGTRFPHR